MLGARRLGEANSSRYLADEIFRNPLTTTLLGTARVILCVLEVPVFPAWSTQLARPITLVDGTKLMTFKDALKSLIANFAGADPKTIEPVIGLLVKADATRKAADIHQASEEFEAILRRRLLVK